MAEKKIEITIKDNDSEEKLEGKALEDLAEGSLFVFKIGDENAPASVDEANRMESTLSEIFGGINNTKVLITSHRVSVEQFSVPQLRNIQQNIAHESNEGQNDTDLVQCIDIE